MKGWNMRGSLSLGTVPGLNIDLPPQTILDIELVEETTVRCITCCSLPFTPCIIIAVGKMGNPHTVAQCKAMVLMLPDVMTG